jgi:putative transposase
MEVLIFFEAGRFQKNHDVDKSTFAAVIGAANRAQMARWQVVGQLDSWLSNWVNEFRDAVNGSTLDPDTRHMFHVINRMGAWFLRADVAMRETGEIIPDDVRRLARSIMRLDHRAACLAAPTKATQDGRVGWWVNLSPMTAREKVSVPLLTCGAARARSATASS